MGDPREHTYQLRTEWRGNRGTGTSGHRAYGREHEISVPGKPPIAGSSDPAFRGDPSRYNPEDLLVASLSACHMLWYLHLCSDAGIAVVDYVDEARGTMRESADGSGRFVEVVLRPTATIQDRSQVELAAELHDRAHALCFIANSVNFPVRCEPVVRVQEPRPSSAG